MNDNTSKDQTYEEIPIFDLQDIQKKYKLQFNTLVVDCEGCLETFFKENMFIIDQLDKIIYELDRPDLANYDFIDELLYKNKFIRLVKGHQNVWIKKNKLPI